MTTKTTLEDLILAKNSYLAVKYDEISANKIKIRDNFIRTCKQYFINKSEKYGEIGKLIKHISESDKSLRLVRINDFLNILLKSVKIAEKYNK